MDDIIAENDEIFIIYTSVIEDPEDRCASAVLLQDNDGEKLLHVIIIIRGPHCYCTSLGRTSSSRPTLYIDLE